MHCKHCGVRLEKLGYVVQRIVPATKLQIEEEQLSDIHVVTDKDSGADFLFLVEKQNFFCNAFHAAEHLLSISG